MFKVYVAAILGFTLGMLFLWSPQWMLGVLDVSPMGALSDLALILAFISLVLLVLALEARKPFKLYDQHMRDQAAWDRFKAPTDPKWYG